jgi:RNA polymerase sigma factor (sigma-70 family)
VTGAPWERVMGIDSSVEHRSNDRDVAFARFYESELPGQIRSATLILGSRSSACDAVQDAFTEVLRRWEQIEAPGPYLQTCVINRCRDLMRRQRVADRKRHLLAPSDIPEVDVPLFDALGRLPFNHRAAVVLRFYLQLSEVEIAVQLGCPNGSVGPWIRRGLDRLAKELRLSPEEDQ